MLGVFAGERARNVPEAVRVTNHRGARSRPVHEREEGSGTRESAARYGALACMLVLFLFTVLRRSTDRFRFRKG